MRFEKICFSNFRKYVNTSISFKEDEEKDFHVIIADNGAGKTTFLNAITWCLYNEEPKVKNEDEALPTLNTNVSENSKNEIEKASVSITMVDNDMKWVFVREDIFEIHDKNSDFYKDNNGREEKKEQEFYIIEIHKNIKNKITKEKECEELVNYLLPKGIKEFFFFDGEQLDNYFLSSPAIKDQVFTLSHLFLLESMERRLNEKLNKFRRSCSSNNKSDDILKKLEDKKVELENKKIENKDLEYEYLQLKKELDNLMDKIGNAPSLEQVEEKRDNKINEKNKYIDLIKNKKKQMADLRILESPKILVKNAYLKSSMLIDENKDSDYIYPIDKSVLIDSINEEVCKVCDRRVNDEIMERLLNKKAKLYLISPEDKLLNENKNLFNEVLNNSNDYSKKFKSINNDIETMAKSIDNLENDINNAYNTIKIHENLRDSIEKRDELIDLLPDKSTEIANLNNRIEELRRDEKKLEKEYEDACFKDKENKEFRFKNNLCKDSLNVIKKVKQDMLDITRKKIENETKISFFNLIRKDKAYEDVEINKDYEVKLYDQNGRAALATASASERELLALSFTLAIHKISGFESPIVMDTILARTSGIQRINVAQGCLDVSKDKQILLFLMEDEYTPGVQELYQNNINKYLLIEDENEKEILIKEV